MDVSIIHSKLWKGIYQNGEKLKAEVVCLKCPKKHF